MKLYIDPNNYRSLKVLITAKVTGDDVGVVETDITDSLLAQRPLPLLAVSEERTLFTENSICRYLFMKNGKSPDKEIDLWIEWESVQLQPYLQPLIIQAWGGPKADGEQLITARQRLELLESTLRGKKYISRTILTMADIVIWVTIFPLAVKSGAAVLLLKDYHILLDWFHSLSKESCFSSVININDISILDKLKASFLGKGNIRMQLNDLVLNNISAINNQDREVNATEPGQEILLSIEEINAAYLAWQSDLNCIPEPRESQHPLHPVDGERNVLITSALPYVNNVPHLGNIIGCVLSADVFARFSRLRNYNTLFVCGTDEYGTATETKAIEEGVTPQQICDKYHQLHSDIYKWFDISFDYFGRTTTEQQTKIAQDIFWRLHKGGFTTEDSVEQLLCESCNRFLADRFVEGICPFCAYEDARGDQCDKCGKLINAVELKKPRCKLCKSEPVKRSSNHIFLNLPKLEPTLTSWIEVSTSRGHWSSCAKVISRSWIRDGLKPRCITRDLKWGTPVPLDGYKDKVFYVWFDAPIGYLSITANYTGQWEKWWKNPEQVELFQFMAKDNVPFHSVIFPSCQLGADDNYTLISHLVATEYLNYEDTKFSKSRGVGVFGNDAKETGIPPDIWRFYLLYIRPETQDSVFSWNDLMTKNNSELLNNLGNFVNRVVMFTCNNFGGVVPEMNILQEDKVFIAHVSHELNIYIELMETARLRDAVRHVLNISRYGNQYIQFNKPWVLIKGSSQDKAHAGTVMGICLNVSCLLSVMVQPYMPTISKKIQDQLSAPKGCNILLDKFVCHLLPRHKIGKPDLLFHKMEQAVMDEFHKRFAGQSEVAAEETTAPSVTTISEISNQKLIDAAGLAAAVIEQGNKVRDAKAKKCEKSLIDIEVAKLLELKLKLAVATGQDPSAVTGQTKQSRKKWKK